MKWVKYSFGGEIYAVEAEDDRMIIIPQICITETSREMRDFMIEQFENNPDMVYIPHSSRQKPKVLWDEKIHGQNKS